VFLEDAGALADLGDRRIPVAALTDGELQSLIGGGGRCRQRTRSDEQRSQVFHDVLPGVVVILTLISRLVIASEAKQSSAESPLWIASSLRSSQ
jgi:hypothetical protein